MAQTGRQRQRATACRLGATLAGCLVLANCAGSSKLGSKVDPKYGVSASPRVIADGEPVPKGGGAYRIGKPYAVGGKTFTPHEGNGYRAEGLASWYGDDFHGRLTANGEIYDMHAISAAHPTLPMPSYVRVTNATNRKSLIVRVNDRGPFHNSRLIDLSAQASHLLGFRNNGLARVKVEYVGPAALEGSDDRMLLATLREDGPAPAPSRVMVASAKPFLPTAATQPAVALRGTAPAAERMMGERAPLPQAAPQSSPSPQPRIVASALPPAPDIAARSVPAPEDARTGQGVLRWSRGAEPALPSAGAPVSGFAPQSGGYVSGRGLY